MKRTGLIGGILLIVQGTLSSWVQAQQPSATTGVPSSSALSAEPPAPPPSTLLPPPPPPPPLSTSQGSYEVAPVTPYQLRVPYQESPEESWTEGSPVPPGYHVETRRKKGLIIAGSIVFGVSYGGMAFAAVDEWDSHDHAYRYLVVPIAGPWIALANRERCSDRSSSAYGDMCFDSLTDAFLVLDGLAQATGALLLTFGLTSSKEVLVPTTAAFRPRITRIAPSSVASGTVGLVIGGEL